MERKTQILTLAFTVTSGDVSHWYVLVFISPNKGYFYAFREIRLTRRHTIFHKGVNSYYCTLINLKTDFSLQEFGICTLTIEMEC